MDVCGPNITRTDGTVVAYDTTNNSGKILVNSGDILTFEDQSLLEIGDDVVVFLHNGTQSVLLIRVGS